MVRLQQKVKFASGPKIAINVSKKTCFFGDPKVEVEIVVAWSAPISGKRQIAAEGRLFEVFQDQGWMSE
jgi:hypothetical protein